MKARSLILSASLKASLKTLFADLAIASITSVSISFNGGGDEGSSESPVCEGGEMSDELEARATKLGDEVLEASGYDWYNNDGGFGTLTFVVKTGKIDLDMNLNEQTSHQYPMTVKL